MKNIIRGWHILPALFLLAAVAGCASHLSQAQHTNPAFSNINLSQYPAFSNLPVIIKQPEAEMTATNMQTEGIAAQTEKALNDMPKVSNLWEETDLRAVLQDMAAQTNVNIIFDDTVEGAVTANLKEIPLEEALKMILQPWGYTSKKVDNYYLVGPAAPGMPFSLSLSETETTITNRPAEEVIELLSSDLTPFLKATKGGYCLSVTAPPEIIARFKKDLEVIDTPQPLIVIEVLVTEVKQSQGSAAGIDWTQILNLSASGDMNLTRGVEMAYTGILKGNLASSVQMLAQQGNLNLRASPKVVTRNGEEAEINVGKEQYAILYESSPGSAESSSYYWYPRFEAKPIKSGVTLKVTPQISREGEVVLELNAEVSDIGQASNSSELPVVEKRSVKTTVRIKPGGTVVLGGLYQELSREVKRGIPVLSRIPGLSFLFQKKRIEKENTELVIFVTPKVLSL